MMISPDISTEQLMQAMEDTASRYPQGRLQHVRILALDQRNAPDWIASRVGIDMEDIGALIQVVSQGYPGEGPVPPRPWTLKAMRAMKKAGHPFDSIGNSMTPRIGGLAVQSMLEEYRGWEPA